MDFSKLIYVAILAAALFAAGFGPEGPTTPDLVVTGLATFEDGTPIAAPLLSFSVSAIGDGLFSHSRGCSPSQGKRQGQLKKVLGTNAAGAYSLEISSEDFLSTDNGSCASSGGTIDDIEVLQLDVSLPADFRACASFCHATRPEHPSSCLAECTSGNRRLLGTKRVLRQELAARKLPLGRHMSGINEIAVVIDHFSAAAAN